MATIKFKAKPRNLYDMEDNVIDRFVTIPELTRSHCDLPSFRGHKFGHWITSDLSKNILNGIRSSTGKETWLGKKKSYRIDESNVPDNVTIDKTKFLWEITITI